MSDIFDINATGKLELDFYFDFLCPFSYQASIWIRDVADLMGTEYVDLRWRFISLAQLNRKSPDWNVWEHKPEDEDTYGLLALLAGAAALKSSGMEGLGRFYRELGRLHHEKKEPLTAETIEKAAQASEVQVAAAYDGSDPELYEILKQNHHEGVEKYGVFGTSTLVFEEKYGFYLKIMPSPPKDRALDIFQHIQMLAMVEKNVFEVKRLMTAEASAELNETVSNPPSTGE